VVGADGAGAVVGGAVVAGLAAATYSPLDGFEV